jgi:hypothetical protein
MDAPGTTLFLGAVCCLLLVLQWGGQTYPWNDGRCIALFVLFGVATAAFCFVESKRGELAIIPLRVLRKRSILMGSLALFSLGMSSLVVSCLAIVVPFPVIHAIGVPSAVSEFLTGLFS